MATLRNSGGKTSLEEMWFLQRAVSSDSGLNAAVRFNDRCKAGAGDCCTCGTAVRLCGDRRVSSTRSGI